jgi:hypothetical protein
MRLAIRQYLAVVLTVATMAVIASATQADSASEMKHTEKPGTIQSPAAVPPAAEKDWSVTADFTVYSEYIFRGVDLSGNDIMLSPSATIAWKGFSAYYWGAFSDSDSGNNTWYEETDLGVDYTFRLLDGKLSLTGGALWYLYLDGVSGPDTMELYAKASYNTLLTPTVSLYYDIDEFHGGYLSFGVSHSFDIGSKMGLKEGMSLSIDPSATLSVDLGYNSRSSGSDVQFNDLLLGVNVPFQITEHVCIHAGVQFSVAMDSLNDIGQGNELIGNAGVKVSF